MWYALFLIACMVPVIALARPDDATLSRLLVGTLQGPRHQRIYRADGTWILDEGDNTRGKWRIERGKLIETWRFSDESSDSTSIEEIIELGEKILSPASVHRKAPVSPKSRFFRTKFSPLRV